MKISDKVLKAVYEFKRLIKGLKIYSLLLTATEEDHEYPTDWVACEGAFRAVREDRAICQWIRSIIASTCIIELHLMAFALHRIGVDAFTASRPISTSDSSSIFYSPLALLLIASISIFLSTCNGSVS